MTINFDDLTPISETVFLGGQKYTLKEATGEAARRYNNARLSHVKLGADGKPQSVTGMADVESLLVSLCLFDANDKNVSTTTILSWPARVQKVLYARAKEISQLEDAETEEQLQAQLQETQAKLEAMQSPKNDADSTTDGSD